MSVPLPSAISVHVLQFHMPVTAPRHPSLPLRRSSITHEHHLAALVRQYQISIHPRLSQELAFYQQLPIIDLSIEYAALAKLPNGKRC
jgi:hypothetical protein